MNNWYCKRCESIVDYEKFKCNCTTSPSPWEQITEAPDWLKERMNNVKNLPASSDEEAEIQLQNSELQKNRYDQKNKIN